LWLRSGPAYSPSSFKKTTGFGDPNQQRGSLTYEALAMTRFMPITGVDCTPATLLIDTEAPLDVLFETADYRIRTVTQLLENIAFRSDISSDTVVLSDFCKLLTISLRDGCDVLDVIGRRLRAQAVE